MSDWLIKEKCPHYEACDKYLSVCKYRYFNDCIHLPAVIDIEKAREEMANLIFNTYFKPMLERI